MYIRIDMEQESVHQILDQTPEEESQNPVSHTGGHIGDTRKANRGTVGDTREPQDRNDIPCRLAEGLEEVAKERSGFATLIVTRTMDLLQIEILAETAIPQLHEKRLVEVEELVPLEIFCVVGFDGQVFLFRHARSLIYDLRVVCRRGIARVHVPICVGLLRSRIRAQETNKTVIQDFVGRLGMFMRNNIAHDLSHVFAGILENQIASTRVIIDERGDIVYFRAKGHIARLGVVMGLDLGRSELWQDSSRHGRKKEAARRICRYRICRRYNRRKGHNRLQEARRDTVDGRSRCDEAEDVEK